MGRNNYKKCHLTAAYCCYYNFFRRFTKKELRNDFRDVKAFIVAKNSQPFWKTSHLREDRMWTPFQDSKDLLLLDRKKKKYK